MDEFSDYFKSKDENSVGYDLANICFMSYVHSARNRSKISDKERIDQSHLNNLAD